MHFEWDDAKNERNIQHHKLDFADATNVFEGPLLTDRDDRLAYGEDRWVSIGFMNPLVIVVVWTERNGDTIRIISARKANKHERKRYEAYITNRLGAFGEYG
ncbi:MAG: BrnT family toxin [Oscillochloridaceae bacterium umkhey_bin13]